MARVRHVLTAFFRTSVRILALPAAGQRIAHTTRTTARHLGSLSLTSPTRALQLSRGARQSHPLPPAKYHQHGQHRELICHCRAAPHLTSPQPTAGSSGKSVHWHCRAAATSTQAGRQAKHTRHIAIHLHKLRLLSAACLTATQGALIQQ